MAFNVSSILSCMFQGAGAGSAAWCTNVGNERGEVLTSVFTTSESITTLELMAEGLMSRYSLAKQPDPLCIYTGGNKSIVYVIYSLYLISSKYAHTQNAILVTLYT